MDNFTSLEPSGDPGGIKVVELSAYEKYISFFVTVAPPWRIFPLYWKCCPMSVLLSMVIKKSVFVSINSHNFNFSTEMHSLKAWLWNISIKNWLVCNVTLHLTKRGGKVARQGSARQNYLPPLFVRYCVSSLFHKEVVTRVCKNPKISKTLTSLAWNRRGLNSSLLHPHYADAHTQHNKKVDQQQNGTMKKNHIS